MHQKESVLAVCVPEFKPIVHVVREVINALELKEFAHLHLPTEDGAFRSHHKTILAVAQEIVSDDQIWDRLRNANSFRGLPRKVGDYRQILARQLERVCGMS